MVFHTDSLHFSTSSTTPTRLLCDHFCESQTVSRCAKAPHSATHLNARAQQSQRDGERAQQHQIY